MKYYKTYNFSRASESLSRASENWISLALRGKSLQKLMSCPEMFLKLGDLARILCPNSHQESTRQHWSKNTRALRLCGGPVQKVSACSSNFWTPHLLCFSSVAWYGFEVPSKDKNSIWLPYHEVRDIWNSGNVHVPLWQGEANIFKEISWGNLPLATAPELKKKASWSSRPQVK